MAQIKSALELALENTADIVGDKAAIKRKELEEQGRRLASKFLFDPETTSDELAKALKETKKKIEVRSKHRPSRCCYQISPCRGKRSMKNY